MLPGKHDCIYVAGHRGMVGSAIYRALQSAGYDNLLTASHGELDLTRQAEVEAFIGNKKPHYVVLAAARVGGIHANDTYPAEFIYQNLMMESNVINAAWQNRVAGLLFLGSSCIYPRLANQPMREDELLNGALESTNEPYAVAKIAGIKLCESYNRQYGTDFRSVMPTNLYGTGDNFDAVNSHVIPALMRRFHEARLAGAESVGVWGSGKARREFLHVDDLASACLRVMQLRKNDYDDMTEPMLSHINIGTGEDVSIAELAELIKSVTGFEGNIDFDKSKPDGTPRKLLDISRIRQIGWQPSVDLADGLARTYDWYLQTERDGALRAG